MNKKILGYIIVVISFIIPFIIMSKGDSLAPNMAIIGADGVVVFKGMMIMCSFLILSKLGFHLISDKDM